MYRDDMQVWKRQVLGLLAALLLVSAGCGGSGGRDEASCVPISGNEKFCLVANSAGDGDGLSRVRALQDITVQVGGESVVVAVRGELGGWVEEEDNLSADGSAWVRDDARVFDGARVEGDAQVSGNAEVSGGAVVRDRAQVSGRTKVFDGAQVSDVARVVDAAVVCSGAKVFGQAQVGGQAVVCGWVPSVFSPAAWDGAGDGAKAARMVAWVQGWSELSLETPLQRAGLGGVGVHVFGDAVISDEAWVIEQAKVFGEADISDQAMVYERAQVFDNSRMADQASVFGSAFVFLRSDSEYVSGISESGEMSFSPVFTEDDMARKTWTDSHCRPHQWSYPRKLVEDTVFLEGLNLSPDCEESPSGKQLVGDRVPTQVYGRSHVFGNSRVWGGSHIFGYAIVAEEARVSGGSEKFVGRLCGSMWINSSKHGGTVVCLGEEESFGR